MAFGDHVGLPLLVAWLAPALAIGAGDLWQGQPGTLVAGLIVAAPALCPTVFAILYIAMWVLSRETGWPGRSTGRSFRSLAFWLLVAGLPGLLSFPVALTALTNAPPQIPAGLQGGGLPNLLERGDATTFLLVMVPASCTAATVVALWLCTTRLLARRRGPRPELPLVRDLGLLAPTLAIGFLAVLALTLPIALIAGVQADPDPVGAAIAGVVGAFAAGPLLTPVILSFVLLALARSPRGPDLRSRSPGATGSPGDDRYRSCARP